MTYKVSSGTLNLCSLTLSDKLLGFVLGLRTVITKLRPGFDVVSASSYVTLRYLTLRYVTLVELLADLQSTSMIWLSSLVLCVWNILYTVVNKRRKL